MTGSGGRANERVSDQLYVHGGLVIRRDGTYSAEKGIDPLRDTVALRSRLLLRLDLIDAFLARNASEDAS